MKAYLDSYGVSHANCVEKSELIALTKATFDNPPEKKKVDESSNKVGEAVVKLLGPKLKMKTGSFATNKLQAKVVALYFSAHWSVTQQASTSVKPCVLLVV